MGAWGAGVFENDDACDFAAEVAGGAGLEKVNEALEAVLETNDYLEAPSASEGLAAADVVARLRGNRGESDAYTKAIDEWVERAKIAVNADLIAKAREVVTRVRTAPSELLELWEEGDPGEWLNSLDELTTRLS
jgi:hypothetical protein